MPSFSFLVEVVRHTPRWVWVALLAVLAAGLAQARPRQATIGRLVALPAALTALSLGSVAGGFGHLAAVAGWALGLAAATALALALGAPVQARWDAGERRLALPGSWLPLALMLGIFATKYVVGVLVALAPMLRRDPAFAAAAGLAYGAFSGLFLGRALALLTLARVGQALPLAAAAR